MRNLQKVRRRASRFGSLALAVAVLSLSGCTSGGVTAPTGAPAAATSTPTPSTHVYTGIFTPTADLAAARWGHTATLLPNGRVLITGGADLTGGFDTSSNTLASAELYDPASGTFTPTASLAAARASHTATRLSDGRVLITGGDDSRSSALASAELYDPASGAFTPTADLATARWGHTATLLLNGRVLITGGIFITDGLGSTSSILASAELYDPASGAFTPTADLATPRAMHTSTLLPDGRVLIAGGSDGHALASAELYDPASGTFTPTADLAAARYLHAATLLPDGRVLVTGGFDDSGVGGSALASAELYDPASGTFTPTADLAAARATHTATLLSDGRVLVAGGQGGSRTSGSALASAESYDPASGTFTPTADLTAARELSTATLLSDGRVLIAGGSHRAGSAIASADLYR